MQKKQEDIRSQLKKIRNLQENTTERPDINIDTNKLNDDQIQTEVDKIIDEFKNQVSQVAQIESINVYDNNVEMRVVLMEYSLDISYSLTDGVYITGTMIELNQESITVMNNIYEYYNQFKSVFSNLIY